MNRTGNMQDISAETVPLWTYFFLGDGEIKIGRSIQPRGRLRQLQANYATELKLLLVVPAERISEAAAHFKFKHIRLHGEWFAASKELLDFIEVLKSEKKRGRQRRRRLPMHSPFYAPAHALRHALKTMPKGAKRFAYNALELMEGEMHRAGDHPLQQPEFLIRRQLAGLEQALRQQRRIGLT